METSILVKFQSLIKRFFERYQKIRKVNPFIGKTQKEKLDYLNSLQYSVFMKEIKDRFYLIIPEISIVSVNNKLEEAYKDLNEQKQGYFTKVLACEAEDEINFPHKIRDAHEIYHKLKLFTYKLFIICLLGGVTLTITGAIMSNKIVEISNFVDNKISNTISDITGPLHPSSLVDIAKKIVSETKDYIVDVPEEMRQERLENLRELVIVLRPLVQELETLFISPPDDEQQQLKNKK